MIKTLKKSLEIDIAYSVNSFIYVLRKLPILKDLFTEDIYSSNIIKKIIGLFGILFSLGRVLLLKFFYFFVIFYLTYRYFPDTMVKTYFHVYFVLTIIGLFINNKLLNTSKKKYFSIILFNMDATKFFRANLCYNLIGNLILNTIWIFFFGTMLSSPIFYNIVLIIFTLVVRIIGECLNIMYYKKFKYIWYSNTKLYFTILLSLLAVAALPYFSIYIPLKAIVIVTGISIILSIPSLIYLLRVKDFKLIYKKLSQMTNVMDSKNDKDYLKQAMVEVKEKDKIIDNKKIEGKKGYDLFNTIFFERHKEILIRSAKKYSWILFGIYVFLGYLILTKANYKMSIGTFLNNNLGWFVVIMYFINRGAIITQAMFFNCDHAMLCFNFYREPNNLLGLFKRRLLTVIKVNLLPAFVIGVGNIVLLILTGNYTILTLITTFLFIIFLSILFSVHYLVIYYLLQPFNKEMEVKKASYSFATLATYIITYMMTNVVMNSIVLSILGLLVTIIYIFLSLKLVYKFAPITFKLN